MTTYYVDAIAGSDSNTGTSTDTPLASIAAVNKLHLSAGDTVLFARGESFSGELMVTSSGTATNPITYGAYGVGDDPTIGGGAAGIHGSKTSNIVIHDMTIANTTGNAIFAGSASNWTVENVHVVGTGSPTTSGAISFENSSNMTVRDSTITGVTGDGIWVSGGNNILLQNNHVGTVQGSVADAVQITSATNVSVIGNTLDMSGVTNSTKGDLVVNHSTGVVIENNTMIGGSYGASVNSDNVTIAYNEIYGQTGYTWTFGIGIGETWAVKNYNIYDNYIHDVLYGVAVTGKGTAVGARTDIEVHDNTFDNIAGAALKVDRAATGEFDNNNVGSDSAMTRISSDVAASGTFAVDHNTVFLSTGPQAVADAISVARLSSTVHGDLLANDVGHDLSVVGFASEAVNSGLSYAGKYGTVTINPDGTFSYAVNDAAHDLTKAAKDVFSYLVTDGSNESVAHLTVNLAPRVNVAPVASDDATHVDSAGIGTGNVLANDKDANLDTLYVRTVAGEHVSGNTPTTVEGNYGTLTITANGQYTYTVDPGKVGSADTILSDHFFYKISDSSLQDTGNLGIYIDPHTLTTHMS